MINEDVRHIIEPKLLVSETLLWASRVSDETIQKEIGLSKFVRSIFGKSTKFKDPVFYAITNLRLLALTEGGDFAEDMPLSEMELYVDLGNGNREFLVSRKNDPDSERGFHFYLADNLFEAKQLLTNKFELK